MSTLKFNRWQSIDGVTRNAVLQVVSKEVSTEFTTTSESFVDATDMFLAITPTSATSKILVKFNVSAFFSRSSTGNYVAYSVLRDSTEVFNPSANPSSAYALLGFNATGATGINFRGIQILEFLDSPNTVSEITYKLQCSLFENANSGSVTVNQTGAVAGQGKSTITLMEIAQ